MTGLDRPAFQEADLAGRVELLGRARMIGLAWALTALLGLSMGCGVSKDDLAAGPAVPAPAPLPAAPSVGVPEAERRKVMGEVGLLLIAFQNDNHRGPLKMVELDKYQSKGPAGSSAINAGNVVVVWGSGIVLNEAWRLVAFEKDTPQSGGLVLMADGVTVRKLTADQFKTTPRR
jgi:hypothetical protein